MTSKRIDAALSTAGGWRALLIAGMCAAGGLMAAPADAQSLDITTTGTIISGADASDIFGAGSNLAGDSYTMLVEYDALGPNYGTNGLGTNAMDIGDPLTGFVTVSINGGPQVTTDLLNTTQATLSEDPYNFFDANAGTDVAGNYTSVSQEVDSSNPFVPYSDLQTPFQYTLQPGDFGQDTYYFQNAGDTVTAEFTGSPDSLQVPEPRSWLLLASGLLGFGLLVRRSRA